MPYSRTLIGTDFVLLATRKAMYTPSPYFMTIIIAVVYTLS